MGRMVRMINQYHHYLSVVQGGHFCRSKVSMRDGIVVARLDGPKDYRWRATFWGWDGDRWGSDNFGIHLYYTKDVFWESHKRAIQNLGGKDIVKIQVMWI